MSADDILQIRRRGHEALLQHAQEALQADQRVVATWLFGSVGRRTADVFSDLDVWVIVKDECIELMSAERQSYAAQLDRPVLLLESPGNAPAGGAYLMACYPGTSKGCIRWIGTGSDNRMQVYPAMRCCCFTVRAFPAIATRTA